MTQEALHIMQGLTQELSKLRQSMELSQQNMFVMELNSLWQICANLQLSEEVRNVVASRLEELVTMAYSKQYASNSAKQFK